MAWDSKIWAPPFLLCVRTEQMMSLLSGMIDARMLRNEKWKEGERDNKKKSLTNTYLQHLFVKMSRYVSENQ